MSFNDHSLQAMLHRLAASVDNGQGRTLQQLLATNDPLKGVESQRLRTFFTTESMEPYRDLDDFGRMIFAGDLEGVKSNFTNRMLRLSASAGSPDAAREAAAKEIFELKWGPTRVPIYNLLLLSTLINSDARSRHLTVLHWLIGEAKVSVDGTDLSGSTALYHAISTKPTFDPEFAHILYEAGADVNKRNRYGGTAAHEIALVWDPQNKAGVRRAADALKWYLDHGGNIDIKDNDGATARSAVEATRHWKPDGVDMLTCRVVDQEDKRRKDLGGKCCSFCGKESHGELKLLKCSQCRSATYCAPPCNCQKADWPRHKEACKRCRNAVQN